MHIENLETRRYFALGTGVITINGTDNPENWQITQVGTTITLANLNNPAQIIDTSSSGVTQIIIDLKGGEDTVRFYGLSGTTKTNIVKVAVSVMGGNGNDHIFAGDGNDTLRGQGGTDEIYGGNGNDRIALGDGVGDFGNGEGGSDTIDYSAFTGAVNISLDGLPNDGPAGEFDVIASMENILGGAGNDLLIGNTAANAIDGGGGNDRIVGGGANDTLTGGIGQDTLWGEDGNDFLFAKEPGTADKLNDGPGTDSAQIDSGVDGTIATAPPTASAALMAMLAASGFEALEVGQSPAQRDDNFGSGGVFIGSTPFDFVTVNKVLIQNNDDGDVDKVLLIGSASTAGDSDFFLMRLDENGALDLTFGDDDGLDADPETRKGYTVTDFNVGGESDDFARSAAIDSLDRIVLVGTVQGNDFDFDYGLARYSSDGQLDTTFGENAPGDGPLGTVQFDAGGSASNDALNDIVVQESQETFDDEYVVVGSVTDETLGHITRFDDTGANDGGYGGTYTANSEGEAEMVDIESDGFGILWVLSRESDSDSGDRAEIRSFTAADGDLNDSDFYLAPDFASFSPSALIVDDDELIVAGTIDGFNGDEGILLRWDIIREGGASLANLSQTPVINNSASEAQLEFTSLTWDAPNRAVAAGISNDGIGPLKFAVYRFTTDGGSIQADSTFASSDPNENSGTPGLVVSDVSSFDDEAYSIAVDSQGRLVVGGEMNDGSEPSFRQPLAARYLGGDVVTETTIPPELDITFNPEGTLPGTLILEDVGSVSIEGSTVSRRVDEITGALEYKTYLVGTSNSNVSLDMVVIRLNEDGSLDTTFGNSNGEGGRTGYAIFDANDQTLHETGVAVQVLEDGSVVLAGTSQSTSGGPRVVDVVWFEADGDFVQHQTYSSTGGSIDEEAVDLLVTGSGASTALTVLTYIPNGGDQIGILRLDVNGVLDTGFSSTYGFATGLSLTPVAAALDPTGNIHVLSTNASDVGALISSFSGTTGAHISDYDLLMQGNINAYRAADIAISSTGVFFVVGTGSFDTPDFGVIHRGTFSGGVPSPTGFVAEEIVGGDPDYIGLEFNDVAIDANGAAYVAGRTQGNLALFRTASNSPDGDFNYGNGGLVVVNMDDDRVEVITGIVVQGDGKIVVSGFAATEGPSAPLVARFVPDIDDPEEIADNELTDEDVEDLTDTDPDNGQLTWEDGQTGEQSALGNYFLNRINDPKLQGGVLTFNGNEGNTPAGFAALAEPVGPQLDDEFVIGRLVDDNGVEYLYIDANGDGWQYNFSDVTTLNILAGGGHATVRILNDLGITLNLKGLEDQFTLIVEGVDADDNPVPVTGSNDPAHGTATISSGVLTYTPDLNYFGPDSLTYNFGSASQVVNIELGAVNDAPTDVTIAPGTIQENQAPGTSAGTFSTVDIDNSNPNDFTYELVDGVGSTDNGAFEITAGGVLVSKQSFDFETKNSYSVRVRSTDVDGDSVEKVLTITIEDVNESGPGLTKFTGTPIGTTPNSSSNGLNKAFDGDLNTYYRGKSALTSWVGVDLGSPQTVTQIKFAPRNGNGVLMLLGRFQASNDATFKTGVVTLHTITTIPPSGALTQQTVNAPGAFRYYRYIGAPGSSSQVAEIEFYGLPAAGDQARPSKPGKPVATRGLTQIALTWPASTDNVGVTRYDIFRNGVKVGESTTNSYTDTGLKTNTSYLYQVQAYDAAGNSSALSDILVTSTLRDSTGPSKPGKPVASLITRNSLKLTWSPSTDNVGVKYYEIYRNGTKIGTSTSATFNVSGLSRNTTYRFTVKAFDEAGNASSLSDQLQVKTLN